MPEDKIYLPIHVGRVEKADLGYLGDDTGDNISAKNANYCELTGLYWAWKNLKCDYIGLCHYRRYFAHAVSGSDMEKKKLAILQRTDYELYEYMLKEAAKVVPVVQHGIFGADMKISLENDGPFTVMLDESIM